ncbi:CpsB/CapC family capsule biosynthesis tyrosine phosphatase [Tellurirhabdus rosea]|uniref:CpsB/CapC family capsule biosynthesis tyrosine phosphatase n=1 Tax=Tellurirhabdus rosea TaxID=2674997 RepID=UPI002258AA15|nr:CpsB/CapC family capsule biosynthesis tyrosine phosphatase [Tellurirhabdus rosea]
MNLPFLPTSRRLASGRFQASPALQTDVFAPILPGQHDGIASLDRSIRLLRGLAASGIQKVVGTLPVMSHFYQNTSESVLETVQLVRNQLQTDRIPIQLIPAAEYYVDRGLMRLLYNQSPLLTFGDRTGRQYLLFDTGLVKAPPELENVLWAFRCLNITPIMAHPEQYLYLQKDPDYLFRLQEQGVLFQVHLLSLLGKPTVASRQLAEWMIDRGLVSFLGSGLAQEFQIPLIGHAMSLPHYYKALEMGVRNALI